MSETSLTDALLRHALELERLADSDAIKVDGVLRELSQDLRILLNSRELSASSRREIHAIIKAADEAIASRYVNIAGVVDTSGIVEVVAERTLDALKFIIPTAAPPSIETLRSLAGHILIDGAPSAAWWAKQSEDTAFKFAAAVRQGVINGRTNEQIVRAVVGGRGETGILDIARRNARALVHSSVMTAANRARLETYRKSARYSEGVRWLSTLDSHTCIQCAVLDESAWDFDGRPIKGTKIEFQAPPAHWNCRCILSIIPSTSAIADVFGKDIADRFKATRDRASADGPVKTDMSGWLKRNPDAAEEILGKRRVDLFQSGKITLTDLVTKSGQPRTLDQLKAR